VGICQNLRLASTRLARTPVLLLVCVVCGAQTQLPDTPSAHQFAAWLERFNRGVPGQYQEYLLKSFPSHLSDMARDLRFRELAGGFDLRKIQESDSTNLVVLVQERTSDQFARITMQVESNEPHRILRMEVRAVPRPPEFALPHMTESQLVKAVRLRTAEDADADRFAGAVLVAKNGKPIFEKAYGLADRSRKIPNTLETRFRIGSMNKMFTATAVLQLAEAGKLQLDDPLEKYLKDYPNKDLAKATIKQLLTHTGGTGDIFGPQFDAHRLELRTLEDYVKLYGNRAPQFEPGSRWEYSNYGFVLLGVVIERACGENYYDYVQRHIYGPAGMVATGSEPEDELVLGRSIGYTKIGNDGPWHANSDTLPFRGTSAGGGYSTVGDLLRFANALSSHTLLNAEFTEILTTGKVDAPQGRYGYGFGDQIINGIRCFGHGGGAPGMNGDLQICPGPGYTIAVLSNMDPPAAERITDFVTNRLPEPSNKVR
jgi:D-alanyl-D-alanine carboxypeptidase